MRKLHLVGLTTDRDGLIFTARKGSKSGGFIVPLDARVLAAVAEATAGDNGQPQAVAAVVTGEAVPKRLRSESALTPREMQARLRAGRTIEEVSAEAGVDTEWVARFAVPILAEQAQVVELARNLVYAKPRLGESSQPLGPSVLQNLSDRGVFLPDDVANAGWSAFQLHDSVWMVRFRYRARGRDQEAQWEIDVPTGRLRARNRHASDLGYVDPERWRRSAEPVESLVDDEPKIPVAPRRRTARNAPAPQPPVKGARPKRAASARPPARTTKTTKTTKATKATTATTKATRTAGRTTKSVKAAPAGAKTSPRTASAKAPAKRRSTKAVPAPDAGPAAGSGSVRMAVAQVSTARVAASMAAADRQPWAAAVRRSPRSQAQPAAGGGARLAPVEPVRPLRRGDTASGRSFQPRPLPAGGEPVAPRVRRVTIPSKAVSQGQPPAMSLPAPRRPARQQEPPAKRRRLRPR